MDLEIYVLKCLCKDKFVVGSLIMVDLVDFVGVFKIIVLWVFVDSLLVMLEICEWI